MNYMKYMDYSSVFPDLKCTSPLSRDEKVKYIRWLIHYEYHLEEMFKIFKIEFNKQEYFDISTVISENLQFYFFCATIYKGSTDALV